MPSHPFSMLFSNIPCPRMLLSSSLGLQRNAIFIRGLCEVLPCSRLGDGKERGTVVVESSKEISVLRYISWILTLLCNMVFSVWWNKFMLRENDSVSDSESSTMKLMIKCNSYKFTRLLTDFSGLPSLFKKYFMSWLLLYQWLFSFIC